MTTRNWKRKIAGSSFALLLLAGAAGTQIVAAGGINEAGLETLGVTEETYDTAKESAVSAYNNEMVALGWVTAEEAAEETEEGDFVRIGRGDYYDVLEKDAFIAAELGVSLAEYEAAEDASFDAKVAARVESGRWTEEQAANKIAIHDFKETMDDDAILAEALGISVADLNSARGENLSYDELLESLGLTSDEVKANRQAIKEGLVQAAVDDGTLTEEQGEMALSGKGNGRRDGGRNGRGGRNQQDQVAPADAEANVFDAFG